MRVALPVAILMLVTNLATAQDVDRKIQFPNIDGYLTLKCDLHIHTIFSDGYVWPTIRVDEAVRDGLDAIAITDHIEYQPWKEDLPIKDLNRSVEVAREAAIAHDLIVIHGTEITRRMPPGHANALFIQDANKLAIDDSIAVYREAVRQGAFIFWNHPNWVQQERDGIPQLSELHKMLIAENLLHGIEVVNDITYSEEALRIAQENNLTVLGTSDIHGLIDWQFDITKGGHRPINLIFTRERTEESIKEALFAGRTATWFDNVLSGNAEFINPLLDSCLIARSKGMLGPSSIFEVEIENTSDARFLLRNMTEYDFYNQSEIIEIEPHSKKLVQVLSERKSGDVVQLRFEVMNAMIAYKEHAVVEWEF